MDPSSRGPDDRGQAQPERADESIQMIDRRCAAKISCAFSRTSLPVATGSVRGALDGVPRGKVHAGIVSAASDLVGYQT